MMLELFRAAMFAERVSCRIPSLDTSSSVQSAFPERTDRAPWSGDRISGTRSTCTTPPSTRSTPH